MAGIDTAEETRRRDEGLSIAGKEPVSGAVAVATEPRETQGDITAWDTLMSRGGNRRRPLKDMGGLAERIAATVLRDVPGA